MPDIDWLQNRLDGIIEDALVGVDVDTAWEAQEIRRWLAYGVFDALPNVAITLWHGHEDLT